MYLPPHLTHDQRRMVYDTLRTGLCEYQVKAALRNLDGEHLRDLPTVVDGQIDLTEHGRSVTCTVRDYARRLRHYEGVDALHTLLRITYSVRVPGLDPEWVDIPVATVAVKDVTREGGLVTFVGDGKAYLAKHTAGEAFTIPKGTQKTEAIKRILAHDGELRSNMDIPDHASKLLDDFTVGPLRHVWDAADEIARSMDLTLAYDGQGIVHGRFLPKSECFTMGTDEAGGKRRGHGWLTSQPKVKRTIDSFANAVWLYYGKKLDQVEQVHLPRKHPLSQWSLARHGVPRQVIRKYEDRHISHQAVALRHARDHLRDLVTETVEVETECHPFPFLDQYDLLRIESADYTGLIRPTWTLPFAPGTMMTLGFTGVRSTGPVT